MTPLASCASTDELSPPRGLLEPHVTTEPSTLMAANAECQLEGSQVASKDSNRQLLPVEEMVTTPLLSSEATEELLPPLELEPHVTTEPSVLTAAKALREEKIATTSLASLEATVELSPPLKPTPHVTTEPSVLMAAKAWSVEEMLTTPLASCPATDELSPPLEL